ncbi:MAG: flagellar filament capping protein FliD [Gammaproteobacteria bacterium]|nr:flagellar filament capping protein FliD [Gammaproteobacteria bacterium]
MSTSPVISVASSSSAGAAGGSVINVSTLVSQLVAAAKAPQESIITNETQSVSAQISAVGQLKSALATFQASLGPVATTSAFDSLSASSSNTTAFSASADSTATLGSYSISVSQLAQAQQIVSTTAWSSGASQTVGTGTLQISLGGTSFSVAIGSSNDTVSGIAAAINTATGNPGVEASVVTGTGGAHLVLTSSLTGAANSITVAETDSGSGLSALTYGIGNTANFTQQTAARDASLSIAGVSYTSASNTVTGALSGITLNLLAATSSPATLTVATNSAAVQANIQAFVAAYSTLQSTVASLGSYNATTNTAGPMLGDALLSGTRNQLRSTLYSIVNTGSATYNSLASIGITTNSDGTLRVNTTKLSGALTADFSAVSQLFSGASGIASSLNSQITTDLASGGSIDSRSQTLVKQENALTQQSNQLNLQMSQLTASLTQQYASLNTLLSSLQSTSSYLTQAFATLPQVQATSAA